MTTNPTARPAFGTVLADQMAVANFKDGKWSAHEVRATGPIEIHPGAHVLHYASTCFEGFKAYRWADGTVRVFRMDKHIERMRQSARLLALPVPDAAQLATMILTVIDRVRAQVPEPPGALYLRPLLYGTMPNIGAASQPSNEATLIVLASPVWDYFAGGMKPLRIYVEDQKHRTADHLGMVKTGGNYAAAMGPTLAARDQYKVDQVLFCPGGSVQETGRRELPADPRGPYPHAQPRLDVPARRDARLAARDGARDGIQGRGTAVRRRRDARLGQDRRGRAVGHGRRAGRRRYARASRASEHRVGSGDVGPVTQKLRSALVAIQTGEAPDKHGWITRV